MLRQKIIDKSINFPQPCLLPDAEMDIDHAFALHTNLMKAYPVTDETGSHERIFNQILSSSLVVNENMFGIMASVFRVFKTPIALNVDKASIVTMTCVLLKKILRNLSTSTPGSWRRRDNSGLFPLHVFPREFQEMQ